MPTPPSKIGLAAFLPDSVRRGAEQAQQRRAPAAPAAAPRSRRPPPSAVAICTSSAGVLVDEEDRLPLLERLPSGGCTLLVGLPSGRAGGVAGLWGRAPVGLRWASVRVLSPVDLEDALTAAPMLRELLALAEADEAARQLLLAAGEHPVSVGEADRLSILLAAAARMRAAVRGLDELGGGPTLAEDMSWRVAVVENTVEISEECAHALLDLCRVRPGSEEADCIVSRPLEPGGPWGLATCGTEHSASYLSEEAVALLVARGARGRLLLGDLEGQDAPSFRGWHFVPARGQRPARCDRLSGRLTWSKGGEE